MGTCRLQAPEIKTLSRCHNYINQGKSTSQYIHSQVFNRKQKQSSMFKQVVRIIAVLACYKVVDIGADCMRNLIPDLSYKLSGSSLGFPCESTRNIYLSTGRYIPRNVIATRMQIFREDAIVALPRYRPGVPFTLARTSLKTKGCTATLVPFPCWEIQEEGNCEALQNVIDIFLDCTDTLWALDIGITNTLEQPIRRCPPKIVGINAVNGQVVKIIDLSSLVVPESNLQYLLVDYDANGRAFIYISDSRTCSMIVYDVLAGKGYRVILPKAVSSGTSPAKDALYMTLVRKPSGNVVYFTFLNSPRLFSIKASFLQCGRTSGAVVDCGPKPGGTRLVLLGTDNGAALFFRYKGESDIYIWNTDTAFKVDNFLLVQKGHDCRLPTQVVPGYKRLMWTIESNFHDFVANSVGCLGPSMAIHPLIKTCD